MSANEKQIAGTHYKQFKGFEPWDVTLAWKLGYLDGTALKYIARWRDKNGVEDLRKAVHFLEKLIEVELGNTAPSSMERSDNVLASQSVVVAGCPSTRLCDATTMADETGDSSHHVSGNLNTTTIMRQDGQY